MSHDEFLLTRVVRGKLETRRWRGSTETFTWEKAEPVIPEPERKISMTIAQTEVRSLPLAALVLSQTPMQVERRKYRTPQDIRELAESIRSVGVIHPIVARPVIAKSIPGLNGLTVLGKTYFSPQQAEDAARDKFELVAGEGRYLGAKEAGLTEIQTAVRELTDEQVEEIQLIENLQRTGLHELVEAEGYEQLHKRGLSAEEIAHKVGKSKASVYARMKLLALCTEARQAFRDGKLNASTALLIARVPEEGGLQKKALKEITTIRKDWDGPGEAMSVREAAKHIQEEYMLRLSSAGFKTEDAALVPKAGACGPCPKRTGNQPELFGDVKGADVCTDPVCFRAKIAAHAERVIAQAKETGQTVITGPAAKKVARYGADSSLEGYVRLDQRDYQAKGTVRQTLGKGYVPTLLQDPESGKMIEVAPEKDVDKAHGDRHLTTNARNADRYKNEQRAAERKHRAEIAYRLALFKAVRDASGKRKGLSRREMELVGDRLLDRLEHDSKKRLFAALGWEAQKKRYTTSFVPPTPVTKMSDEDLAQFVRDAALAQELQVWQHSGDAKATLLEAAAVALDVDAKAIRRSLDAEKRAKEKNTRKASKKGKRK